MQAKFEVALTRQEYVVGLEALTGELVRKDATAPRRLYERLAAYVILILAIGFYFPNSMTGLFVLVVATAFLEWLMARRWTKSVHGISFDPTVYPATVEFSDAAISERSPLRRREWAWTAVRHLHQRDSAVVAELAGWDMIVLPHRLWPSQEDRAEFVAGAMARLPEGIEQAGARAAPTLEAANWFTLAAIAAFVDACLLVTFLLPPYTRRFGPLADSLGFAGGMLLVLVISVALGALAYRAAKSGLPRLHARAPVAANLLAQMLIWAFAVWFAGANLGWW